MLIIYYVWLMKVFFLFIFLLPSILLAQNRTIDSLKLALKNAKHDTTRCNILTTLIEEEEDDNLWPIYNEQLITLAQKCANSSTNSLKTFYLKRLAEAYNNTGYLANLQGDIPKALEYHHKSLKIREEIKDKKGIAGSLNNIGLIYSKQDNIPKALENYRKCLEIYEEIQYKKGIALALNNIGTMYLNQDDLLNALGYFDRSFKALEVIQDKYGMATTLNNMGLIYESKDDLPKALEYFHKCLTILEDINDKEGMALSNNSIAGALLQLGKTNDALTYAKRSLQLSQETGFPSHIKKSAKTLKKIYKKQNKFKEALEMYSLEIQMRDSINNTETRKASIKKQFQYEYEKKAAADSVKHAEEQKVKNALLTAQQTQLKQEKTQRIALYGGLVLVIAFLGFVFNRFKVTQKQKVIIEQQKVLVDDAFAHLEEKNKEVMDSIRYAKRIQTALLTSEKYIERKLNELNL